MIDKSCLVNPKLIHTMLLHFYLLYIYLYIYLYVFLLILVENHPISALMVYFKPLIILRREETLRPAYGASTQRNRSKMQHIMQYHANCTAHLCNNATLCTHIRARALVDCSCRPLHLWCTYAEPRADKTVKAK